LKYIYYLQEGIAMTPENSMAWVRNAQGELVGWVDSGGNTFDASGENKLGHQEYGSVRFWSGSEQWYLGFVVPGGELRRYDYNDAVGKGLGVSPIDKLARNGTWYANQVGWINPEDGKVTDVNGRFVGQVDPSLRIYGRREDVLGTAAIILLLRYG
jgi:hypothetical protein